MDIVIYVIGGILVGALCSYLIFRIRRGPSDLNDGDGRVLRSTTDDKSESLRVQLDKTTREVERMKTLSDSLKQELEQAQRTLKEREQVLLSNLDTNTLYIVQQKSAEYESVISNYKAKLKKAIEEKNDAEEGQQEAEEDKQRLKKQLDRQKEELAELNSLREISQKLHTDMVKKQEELDDLRKNNQQKNNALGFVSNILLAPKVMTEDRTQSQLNAIDQVAKFIEEEYWPLMNDEMKSSDTQEHELDKKQTLNRWVSNKKKTWINGKIAVAFVGEFSAGKTSIVNRILKKNRPDDLLLPVSSKATTAIPTYISGVKPEDTKQSVFRFVSPDETQKVIKEKDFKCVNKEMLDEINGVASLIKYFVMAIDNPNLNNLSILDTPGFNSNDDEDAHRTVEVINECDALFWVVDANTGTLNESSLKTIKKELRKPLYIIINKVDCKSPSEIQQIQKEIERRLRDKEVAVESILSFSQEQDVYLDQLMAVIRQVKPNASTDKYLDTLKEGLTGLHEKVEEKFNQAKRQKKQYVKEIRDSRTFLNHVRNDIQGECHRIATIPKHKKKWFVKDAYEISEEEWKQFASLLGLIETDCDTIIAVSDKIAEDVNSYTKSEQEVASLSLKKRKIEDSINRFDKHIKQLK